MGSYKKSLRPAIVTAIFVILAVSFRSFFLTYVIEPIALLLWAFWRVFSSVDQNMYWIALIFIGSILIIRIFPSVRNESHDSAYKNKKKSLNRIDYWRTLINDAALGRDENKRLRFDLRNLLIAAVAENEETTPEDIQKVVAGGKTPLSSTIQQFLLLQDETLKNNSVGLQHSFLFLGPKWLRRWASKSVRKDYILIDEALRWMEVELEINDEN